MFITLYLDVIMDHANVMQLSHYFHHFLHQCEHRFCVLSKNGEMYCVGFIIEEIIIWNVALVNMM